MLRRWNRRGPAGLLATLLAVASPRPAAGQGPVSPDQLVEAEPPPLSDGLYPCSACHAAQEPNPVRRELAFHEEQQALFAHDPERRWCLDCHDAGNRDVLRLANGTQVPFAQSYRLCGQCHGDKYRDWRAGVHGKRVGRWDGEKTYFLCVNCHDPHAPRFKGVAEVALGGKRTVAPTQTFLRPEPRPLRPEEQRP